ncbi:VPLPA-CTERM sorting domain-containing protein [Roseovarius sp. S1116L3]|uniref:VPLPA-CTERM sorting domain-containing protein n=1 Tax=Roseovarius roseus TaxID=3342636 RepID=UPI003728097E
MTTKIKIASVAAGMLVASAVGASAAVIDFGASESSGGSVTNFPNAEPLIAEFSFEENEDNGAFFAYQDLTVGREFSILLEDYQPSFSGTAQSFFSILNLDTSSYVTTASTCSSTIAAIDGASCNPVNGAEGDAGNPPPISFSGLAAGNYRIGFFESGDPETTQLDVRVSAVPLPAAGFMLFGALGGLAAMRRRKKAA